MSTSQTGLRKNALGLTAATALGAVIMAPALGIYLPWGFMIPSVGRQTSIIFLIALVMSLPTAYSYALINARLPATGATYKWASYLIDPRLGIVMGVLTALFYAGLVPAELAFAGQVGADLVRSTSTAVAIIVMGLMVLLIVPLIYRGVTVNLEVSAVLLSIEAMIVVVIAIGAFVTSSTSHVSLAPLNPNALPSFAALVPALVFGILAFTGYDAISTLADEAKMARRLIPRATILCVLTVGAFWVVVSAVLSDALNPALYVTALGHGVFPLEVAASTAFGSAGRDVLDVMGLEATVGILIACSIASTRIPYAMGRDGALPARFGTVHPRFKVPWFGISTLLVITVAAVALLGIYVGVGVNTISWAGDLVTFFALATYLVINICNPLLYLRHFRTEFHWLKNGAVPAAGVAVTGYFMYKGYFEVLWNANFKLG